mgnify:CR=1 FL=1|tara:strand:+ start:2291 stop:2677 length:387 start_codon:yes stop_codon:yes gene_type:complete
MNNAYLITTNNDSPEQCTSWVQTLRILRNDVRSVTFSAALMATEFANIRTLNSWINWVANGKLLDGTIRYQIFVSPTQIVSDTEGQILQAALQANKIVAWMDGETLKLVKEVSICEMDLGDNLWQLSL